MSSFNEVEKFKKFYESRFGKRVLQREVEYLRRELKGRNKILDIGCGIGVFEQALPELNLFGLDISEAMLREAKKRSDKHFVIGNAEKLPFHSSSFDGVFMITTLEFLKNPKRAVEEVARVLTSSGKFVLMLLNPDSKYFQTHVKRKGSYFRKIRHRNLKKIENIVSKRFHTEGEYFLGIRGKDVFTTDKKDWAALYVIKGSKR